MKGRTNPPGATCGLRQTRWDLALASGRPDVRLAAYYRSPDVLSRIWEFCGLRPESPEYASAWGIAGYGGRWRLQQPEGCPVAVPKEDLPRCLNEGADVCRSLADREGTLLQLDIDYINASAPAEPYLNPGLMFERIEPVYQGALQFLRARGIVPVTVLTGRGYHMTARVPLGGPFHKALAEMGFIGSPLRGKYARLSEVADAVLWGRAHDGAGRLMEHLAHAVLRRLKGRTEAPLTLADVPIPGGGPFICLDLSAYGDPLFERYLRCPFSGNQKSHMSGIAPEKPFVICLPREGSSLRTLLSAREDLDQAARLASKVSAKIPDVDGDDVRWVEEYRASRLAGFHREFDRGRHAEPAEWSHTYDLLDLAALPACVRLPLEFPNPLLLRPIYLRTVALALWGMGWHPRSVAGLIRSKFERDYGWGNLWYRYDAAARADFYVRLFCGAAYDGVDEHLTCGTQYARGACPSPGCGHDLGLVSRHLQAS